jgi:hypothetical protein
MRYRVAVGAELAAINAPCREPLPTATTAIIANRIEA